MDNGLQLWDIVKGECSKELPLKHKDPITCLDLSGNATSVVSSSYSSDGMVSTLILWDLRKQDDIVQEIGVTGEVKAIKFDAAGQYLAVALKDRTELHYFESKTTLGLLATFPTVPNVAALSWGTDAKYLVTSGFDRRVTLLQAATEDSHAAKRQKLN